MLMKKYLLLTLLSLLLFQVSLLAQKRPPNIIVIFVDDMGYGDLSCFGNPTIPTPEIDRMASMGVKLTQFYVAANVCTPSRAALLTGRLPVRNGMTGDRRVVLFPNSPGGLPADEITIAAMLKKKQYATACVGKWHLGNFAQYPKYLPTNYGFDYFFGLPYSNDMKPLPVYRNAEQVDDNPDQATLTEKYTREVTDFIKRNQQQSFFIYYANNFPHVPLFASSKFSGKTRRGLYGDVVAEIDWSVGRILETLKTLKLDKQTLVIFTSDNGPWLTYKENGGSAGPLFEGKGSTWEGGMRVPAIACWPGTIPAQRIVDAPAATLDLLPTIAAITGAALPEGKVLDGMNILPLLQGQQTPLRKWVYYYDRMELYAVRMGSWKAHFITHPSYSKEKPVRHTPARLYNLDADPGEKYDLHDKYPEVVEEITREFERMKASLPVAPSQLDLPEN